MRNNSIGLFYFETMDENNLLNELNEIDRL